MELRKGYKKTEVGVIPDDWEVKLLGAVCNKFLNGGTPSTKKLGYWNGNIPWISGADIVNQNLTDIRRFITENAVKNSSINVVAKDNLLLVTRTGVGKMTIAPFNVAISQDITGVYVKKEQVVAEYLFHYFNYNSAVLKGFNQGTSISGITRETLISTLIPFPPTLKEQLAIATALSDVDALITSLDKLIAKKRNIKQGAMQQLLTGKKRLAGFGGEWEVKSLEQVIDCLDNLRVPLNETQRLKMQGDYPYCGANGILDYVNDYVINDNIILIAEDGGYFDEYFYRPIAYRMSGKCWVNNHAHILKAKYKIDQNFIYYSLVHKNILKFLASGTRAKLNKSELYKIEIYISKSQEEQQAIAKILSEMDAEIETLEKKRDKYKAIKQGMMQELLTGKIRLI